MSSVFERGEKYIIDIKDLEMIKYHKGCGLLFLIKWRTGI